MTFHLGLLFNSIQCCNLGFCVLSIDFPDRANCNNNLGRSGSTVTWFAFILYGSRQNSPFPGAVGCNHLSLQLSFPASFHSTFLLFPTCLLQICPLGSFPAPQEQQCSTQPALLSSLALVLLIAGHQNPSCISGAQLHIQFNFGQESLQNGAVH